MSRKIVVLIAVIATVLFVLTGCARKAVMQGTHATNPFVEQAAAEKERADRLAAEAAEKEKQLQAEREKARLEAELESQERDRRIKEEEAARIQAEKELEAERERSARLEAEKRERERDLQAEREARERELKQREDEAARLQARKELEAERERAAKLELQEKERQAREKEAETAAAEKRKAFDDALVAKKYPGMEGDVFESSLLKDIFFDFDNYEIGAAQMEVLRQSAALLSQRPGMKIQIEGHCDERGTLEYNLALGERRATTVKRYLVSLGISDDRIATISYGKERPADADHTEEAWAKNRRAHFIILSK
jgi:peptidoglycan-associated lipoprotein